MFYVERFNGDNKMFDEKIDYAHFIFLSLNWIFGLLFLWVGIFDTKAVGLFLILISLLLLPPVRAVVFSLTHKKIQMWVRSLCISSLLVVFFMVNNHKQQPLHLEAQSTVLANSIRQHHESTNFLANNSTSIKIKSKKKDTLPEKAVQMQSPNKQQPLHLEAQSTEPENAIRQHHESTNFLANNSTDIQNKSKKKDNLPEKAVQIQSPNTKKANQIKTKDILAKLKNIPVSQYELNKSLYQQLVNFNPSKNEYKKKLSFYSKKVKQQSRNIAKKNIKLTCENIRTNKTFNYSPNWLSANEHCLSKNLKKKMEIALFKKVKKISSKKIEQNWEGYKSLSILNPNKKSYLNKLKHYKNKLKLRTAKI